MNKNILVITTGTRDVQLNINSFNSNVVECADDFTEVFLKADPANKIRSSRNLDFPNSLVISLPRKDGEVLLKNPKWKPFLSFPIISSAFNYIKKQEKSLHHILIVVTNQSEHNAHSRGDTLFFGRLIEGFIEDAYKEDLDRPAIEFLEITQDVTNPDVLYPQMEEAAPRLFGIDPSFIDKVFLLAQGGIDQINQTLTLQLIRFFRHKVVQLQKPEGQEVSKLNFPTLFLNDLAREQLTKHIRDYNFGLIVPPLSDKEEILSLASFAERRLELDYDEKYRNDYVKETWLPDENITGRLKDLFLSAKIQFHRKAYSVYLWKLFTLSENILHPFINNFFEIDVDSFYDKSYKIGSENSQWVAILKRVPGLYEKLSKDKINLNNPNRMAFVKTLSFLSKKGKLTEEMNQRFQEVQSICNTLSMLNNKRNDIAHYLRPLRPSDIESELPNGKSIEDLNSALDGYFGLENQSDMGIYTGIRDRLLELA